jgi:hypothetical protein
VRLSTVWFTVAMVTHARSGTVCDRVTRLGLERFLHVLERTSKLAKMRQARYLMVQIGTRGRKSPPHSPTEKKKDP